LGDQIERNEIGVACAGDRRGHRGFWLVDLMGRDHFEDLGVEGKIILK
jgi:hypothetical protein